jgi:hypothetical protein
VTHARDRAFSLVDWHIHRAQAKRPARRRSREGWVQKARRYGKSIAFLAFSISAGDNENASLTTFSIASPV